MSRRFPWVLLLCLAVWLAACYGLRFAFMEDGQWVGVCAESAGIWQCQLRSALGLMIHWGVLAWLALVPAVLGFLYRGVSAGFWRPLGCFLPCRHWCCIPPA
jgi:hypothetical protein